MNMLGNSILDICKDFVRVIDTLYKNKQITHEQYIEMTKLKLEYINEYGITS